MTTSLQPSALPPLAVRYVPQQGSPLLPVEIVSRQAVLARIEGRELADRQRADFHQLVVCTAGTGKHEVDFESIDLAAGMLLRIHPGQVQRFIPGSDLEAVMIIWPHESHHPDPDGNDWFPGSNQATYWQLNDQVLDKVLGRVGELQREQERFDGSKRSIALMKAMHCVLLLRLAIEFSELEKDGDSLLPVPYVDFRTLIEQRLNERPSVSNLARDLGYSSRTLDRACQQVAGQTARQVLDERIALEIRRLLAHSDRSTAQIALDFGFRDPSNFSKFVKRHLGVLPSQVRDPSSV